MPRLFVGRFSYSPDCTLGTITAEGNPDFDCYAIERPWQDNARGRSCIPEGVYKARFGRHHIEFGSYECIDLFDVPSRSEIQIHRANVAPQLLGCLAVGKRLGALNGQRAVLESKRALIELLTAVAAWKVQEFEVEIFNDPFRFRYGEVYRKVAADRLGGLIRGAA